MYVVEAKMISPPFEILRGNEHWRHNVCSVLVFTRAHTHTQKGGGGGGTYTCQTWLSLKYLQVTNQYILWKLPIGTQVLQGKYDYMYTKTKTDFKTEQSFSFVLFIFPASMCLFIKRQHHSSCEANGSMPFATTGCRQIFLNVCFLVSSACERGNRVQ